MKKGNKFSLIELLIVISVIAILVGFFLPALNSARKTAKSISCKNNLKQLGTCMFLYEQSFERLAAANDEINNYPSNQRRWQGKLWAMGLIPVMGVSSNGADHGNAKLLRCMPDISYAMVCGLAKLEGIESSDNYKYFRAYYINMSRVLNPSIRYLLVDSDPWRPDVPSVDRHFYQPHGPNGSSELRVTGKWKPGGNCNVIFTDGHAGEVSYDIKNVWGIYGKGIGWVK